MEISDTRGKSNFHFMRDEIEHLADLGELAESIFLIDPGSALTRLRSFAEEVVKFIYSYEKLQRLPNASFYELVKSPIFTESVDKSLIY
ncbi:MAG: hypothetical protein HLUCCO02_04075 [Idiomarinaceae bacterium HL-53]|nr:MAG: hypothetical protein HLUCCO02_04075 [Idiomarinaceae bacterium HL-53]